MESSSKSYLFMPRVPSTTSTAMSVLFSVCFVFLTLFSPSAPSSSYPGVSIITTGPRGSSSIAFDTGSVVVPLTSETTASSCPVTALTRLDLPAFLHPKNPICTRFAEGVLFKLMLSLLLSESEISLAGILYILDMLRGDSLDFFAGYFVKLPLDKLVACFPR